MFFLYFCVCFCFYIVFAFAFKLDFLGLNSSFLRQTTPTPPFPLNTLNNFLTEVAKVYDIVVVALLVVFLSNLLLIFVWLCNCFIFVVLLLFYFLPSAAVVCVAFISSCQYLSFVVYIRYNCCCWCCFEVALVASLVYFSSIAFPLRVLFLVVARAANNKHFQH